MFMVCSVCFVVGLGDRATSDWVPNFYTNVTKQFV